MNKIHAQAVYLALQVLQALYHPTDELRHRLQEQESEQEKQSTELKAQRDGLDRCIASLQAALATAAAV